MRETRFEAKIGSFVMWSALAVYLAVWIIGIGHYLENTWLLAGLTGCAYVGMHVYEICQRGHCYLSADSTSVPVSLLVFSSGALLLWYHGHPALAGKRVIVAWFVYGGVFTFGHVAALGYSALATLLAERVLRGRIHQERERMVNRAAL